MQTINRFITEKLRLGKAKISSQKYTCQPKTTKKLRKILEKRLSEDKNADLNDIDVSQITNMGFVNDMGLFENLDPHNIDISEWDVSNVTDMRYMFYECQNFNSDLSKWDVSNVGIMQYMFYDCQNFNSDLDDWNIHTKQNVSTFRMFYNCLSLKNKPSWYKE